MGHRTSEGSPELGPALLGRGSLKEEVRETLLVVLTVSNQHEASEITDYLAHPVTSFIDSSQAPVLCLSFLLSSLGPSSLGLAGALHELCAARPSVPWGC